MLKTLVIGSVAATGFYGISKVIKHACYPVHFKGRETFVSSVPFGELSKTATLSHLAYAEPRDVTKLISSGSQSYSCVAGLSGEPWWYFDGQPKEDAQAYIWHNKQERKVYVAFRGTEDIRDGLVDLDVRRVAVTRDIMVHNGFYRQFASVVDAMDARLATLSGEVDQVVFCGHSLGGALATIAAAYFGHKGYKVKCCTFGSPRVGNARFKECFIKVVYENWRVFNENDPVPMIPISHRFVHVDNGLCINDADNVAYVHHDIPWYLRPFVSSSTIDFANIICDHDCNLYIARLADKKINDV